MKAEQTTRLNILLNTAATQAAVRLKTDRALPHYLGAVQSIMEGVERGLDVHACIDEYTNDRLAAALHKAANASGI